MASSSRAQKGMIAEYTPRSTIFSSKSPLDQKNGPLHCGGGGKLYVNVEITFPLEGVDTGWQELSISESELTAYCGISHGPVQAGDKRQNQQRRNRAYQRQRR